MRRNKKETGASLDSLLDTLTNVVGILVILLTVTQLGVGEAVQRIAKTDSVRPDVYEKALAERNELMRQRVEFEKRLEVFKKADSIDLRVLLSNIADLEASLEVLREGRKDIDLQMLEMRKLQEEKQRRLDEQKKEAEKSETELSTAQDLLAKLKSKLANAPAGGYAASTIITLPNPRSAPEGAVAIPILCREGRVYLVDNINLQQAALRKIETIGKRRNLVFNPDAGVDQDVLIGDFQRGTALGDDNFELKLTAAGRNPKLVFQRKKDGGETAEELRGGRSKFERRIRQFDKNRFYAQFLVWPDSFEVYIDARKLCSERDLLAGWKAQTTKAEYTEDLASDLVRFGPKPIPKPKPPTPPDQEPPKPPPVPKRPPLPDSDID
jgi:hypothetical protein